MLKEQALDDQKTKKFDHPEPVPSTWFVWIFGFLGFWGFFGHPDLGFLSAIFSRSRIWMTKKTKNTEAKTKIQTKSLVIQSLLLEEFCLYFWFYWFFWFFWSPRSWFLVIHLFKEQDHPKNKIQTKSLVIQSLFLEP